MKGFLALPAMGSCTVVYQFLFYSLLDFFSLVLVYHFFVSTSMLNFLFAVNATHYIHLSMFI